MLPEPAPTVLITAADPYRLAELVKRESARHAIVPCTEVVELQRGMWGVEVTQLRPLTRPWVKPVAIGAGVTAGLGALGFMVWAVVSAAAAVLGVLVVLGVVFRLTRGRPTTVDVHVRVRR